MITHQKKERRFRHQRRGKIAKAISSGVSNCYYAMLRQVPVEEILARNITRSLTKDVLKTYPQRSEVDFTMM